MNKKPRGESDGRFFKRTTGNMECLLLFNLTLKVSTVEAFTMSSGKFFPMQL